MAWQRRLFGVVVGFTCFLSSVARAEDGLLLARERKSKKAVHHEEAIDDDNDHGMGASERARVGNEFVLLGEIGLVDVLRFGAGVNAGYYLTRNNVLELDYFQSSFEFLGLTSKVNTIIGRFKSFHRNSFFVQGGLGIRETESKIESLTFASSGTNNTTVTTGTDYSMDFRATHVVGEFSIGNRWEFRNGFTIGCDWVGYVQPIAKMSSSESITGSPGDDILKTERDDFSKTADVGNLTLVRFHLGASF